MPPTQQMIAGSFATEADADGADAAAPWFRPALTVVPEPSEPLGPAVAVPLAHWFRETARAILDGDEEAAAAFFGPHGPGLLDRVVGHVTFKTHRVSRFRIVKHLVEMMAEETVPVGRQDLVEFLAEIATEDLASVAHFARDRRWFVVRNVVIALSRAGQPAALPHIHGQLGHRNDRVRVEALRGLRRLDADASVVAASKALVDRSSLVRSAAISLLHASPSSDVVPLISHAISFSRFKRGDAGRLVAVVAERRGSDVAPALMALSDGPARSRRLRAARREARAMLESPRFRDRVPVPEGA